MKTNRTEKGQALVLIAFGIIALLAMTGLAVDASATYSNRQGAQNAADTSALAGALANANSQPISTAVTNAAKADGFTDDGGVTNKITVNHPPSTGCNGSTPTLTDLSTQYVQVIINTTVNTTFGSLVGIKQTHNCVDAVAEATPATGGAWGSGNGIMALSSSGTAISVTGSGNVTETGGIQDNAAFAATGSGVFNVTGGVTVNGLFNDTGSGNWTVGGSSFVNGFSKTGSQNFTTNGNIFDDGNFSQTGSGSTSSSGAIQVVGSYSNVGSGSVSPAKSSGAYVTPTVMSDPLASYVNPPANPGSCTAASFTGSTNNTLNPGCYTSISIVGSGNLTLNPGTYYISGSGGFSATGSGNVTGSGVLIYLASGPMSMTGSGNLTLSPQTTGAYAGMTVYMDRSNPNDFRATGSGASAVSGTLYAPNADVTVTGSGGVFVVNSQIVASTITLTGSGGLNLQYNANANFKIPTQATIQLTK